MLTNMPLKTLFLNPPSFENFDGGAGSRWPATREIESYWYPVWLAYPAGMLEGARLLDAPPHHVSAEETIEIAQGIRVSGAVHQSRRASPATSSWSRKMKEANPKHQDCVRRTARHRAARADVEGLSGHRFCLPQGVRLFRGGIRERQAARVRFSAFPTAKERSKSSTILTGRRFRIWTRCPRHRRLQPRPRSAPLQRAVPALSVRFAVHHARLPGAVHVLPVAADLSGHAWRKRSTDDVAREMAKAKEYWP